MTEIKKTCSPCQQNAVLHVGDAICHRISHHSQINCHALADNVRSSRMTLDQYVNALEERANEQERSYIKEMRKLYD